MTTRDISMDRLQVKSPVLHLTGTEVPAARCLLPYPRDDRANGLMRDTNIVRHAPQAFAFSPRSDAMPLRSWDAGPFGDRCIPADFRSST